MKQKSNKPLMYIIIGAVLLGVLIVASYFGFTQSVYFVPELKDAIFLKTDFVALLGLETSIMELDEKFELRESNDLLQEIMVVNEIIIDFYGYLLLDLPAKPDTKKSYGIYKELRNFNRELERPPEYSSFTRAQKKVWKTAFRRGVYTSRFLSKVKDRSLSYRDLTTLMVEAEKSYDNMCNGAFIISSSKEFEGTKYSDMSDILQVCDMLPDKIIVRDGNGYAVNFKDVPIYVYDWIETKNCHEEERCYHDGDCDTVTWCDVARSDEKVYKGTLMLSQINLKVTQLGRDAIITLGDKGEVMASDLNYESNFVDYINQIPHEGTLNVHTESDYYKAGYIVVTTNAEMAEIAGTINT